MRAMPSRGMRGMGVMPSRPMGSGIQTGIKKIVMFFNSAGTQVISIPKGARRVVAEALSGGGRGGAGYDFSDATGSGTYGGGGGPGGDYAQGTAPISSSAKSINITVGGPSTVSNVNLEGKILFSNFGSTDDSNPGFTRIRRLKGGAGGAAGYDGSINSGGYYSVPAGNGGDGEEGGAGALGAGRSGGGGGGAGPFGGAGGGGSLGEPARVYGGGGRGAYASGDGEGGAQGAVRLTFT